MIRSERAEADAAAVAQCAAGDTRGIEALYAEYGPCCLAHARTVLVDGRAAEDAVEAAFVELWRRAPAIGDARSGVRGWLLLCTHRHAVDSLRAVRRRPRAVVTERGAADELTLPEAQGVLGLLTGQTRTLLTALAPEERDAVLLAFWGGWTQPEVARLTEAPLSDVRTRLHRAMTRLGGTGTVDLREPAVFPQTG